MSVDHTNPSVLSHIETLYIAALSLSFSLPFSHTTNSQNQLLHSLVFPGLFTLIPPASSVLTLVILGAGDSPVTVSHYTTVQYSVNSTLTHYTTVRNTHSRLNNSQILRYFSSNSSHVTPTLWSLYYYRSISTLSPNGLIRDHSR